MFGTTTAGQLLARSVMTGTAIETPIAGSWFAGSHKFRIDWNAATVVYWIDGKTVATHNISLAGAMQPAAVDLTVGDGALLISYMRMTPYATVGNYTSEVFDAGAVVTWLTTSWTATTPAKTSVAFQYRTSSDGTTWSTFTPIPSSGAQLSGSSRYFQFTFQETTSDTGQTPVVSDVTVAFKR
jgi:hypothetical protein